MGQGESGGSWVAAQGSDLLLFRLLEKGRGLQLEDTAQAWDGVWGGPLEECLDYESFVHEIRDRALQCEHDWEYWENLVNVPKLRVVLKSFNDNSSSDQL